MRIESSDRASSLELTLEECVFEGAGAALPSRRLAVTARLGDFTGRSDQLWIDDGALQRFLFGLRELERTRRGSATLEAMSPEELIVTIQAADAVGHLVVTARLGRQRWVAQRPWRFSVEGGFELDPSALPDVVRALTALAADVPAP